MNVRATSWDRGRVRPVWKVTVSEPETPARGPAVPIGTSDAELVRAVLAGSPEAFGPIVERHRRAVYRLCYRYTGRHEDAADLAQDTFLRAYRSLHTFKGEASLGTWLYRIALNVSLNHVTARAKQRTPEPLEAAARTGAPGESPSDAVLRAERSERVRGAIARLPPKQRATLVLRVYQELPHEEIARVLGISVGASKTNLFHALARLREELRT